MVYQVAVFPAGESIQSSHLSVVRSIINIAEGGKKAKGWK